MTITNSLSNALSGLTLCEMLLDRAWRRLMADQIAEALRVLDASGIEPRGTTALPPSWIPAILRLPTLLFRQIAAQMLTIDPTARTSMARDLAAQRGTEIDAFQGRIAAMGAAAGVATPLALRVKTLIEAAETGHPGAIGLTPDQVRGHAG